MNHLQTQLDQIQPLHQHAMKLAQQRWNSIAKPINGLGLLEQVITQIAGITGNSKIELSRRCAVVFCADHGIVAEGISQTGQEVTTLVAKRLASSSHTTLTIMANSAGADVLPVDIGISQTAQITGLLNHKIALGTQNFLHQPAMTLDQALAALQTGITLAGQLKKQGYHLLAAGEMGIGNTTSAAAITSVLLQKPPKQVTGKGAGLSATQLAHKISVIEQALSMHTPDPNDPLDILCKVGGFDIAGMVGLFLGGGIYRIPILIDGLISSTAALLAATLCPAIIPHLIATHISAEPAAAMILQRLRLTPLLCCNLALGEATGAIATLPLLDMALQVYQKMDTFTQFQMQPYQPLS